MEERISDGKCPICNVQVRQTGKKLNELVDLPQIQYVNHEGARIPICAKHPVVKVALHG